MGQGYVYVEDPYNGSYGVAMLSNATSSNYIEFFSDIGAINIIPTYNQPGNFNQTLQAADGTIALLSDITNLRWGFF